MYVHLPQFVNLVLLLIIGNQLKQVDLVVVAHQDVMSAIILILVLLVLLDIRLLKVMFVRNVLLILYLIV